MLVHAIGSWLLRRLPEDIHERRGNRLLGVIPGFINGLIVAAILSALLLSIPLGEGLTERTRDSALVNRLAVYAERLESQLRPVFGDAIGRSLNLLTIQPDSDERVTLPFKVENSEPRPELETQMLDLVNRERQAAGLNPLQPDPELTEVARRHSADMFARGYFSHDTPDGLTPFGRVGIGVMDGGMRGLMISQEFRN